MENSNLVLENQAMVLYLSGGVIEREGTTHLKQQIKTLIEQGFTCFILNLGSVALLERSAITSLEEIGRQLRVCGGWLGFANAHPATAQRLKESDLKDELITMEPIK